MSKTRDLLITKRGNFGSKIQIQRGGASLRVKREAQWRGEKGGSFGPLISLTYHSFTTYISQNTPPLTFHFHFTFLHITFTSISAKHPHTPSKYLLSSFNLHWQLITSLITLINPTPTSLNQPTTSFWHISPHTFLSLHLIFSHFSLFPFTKPHEDSSILMDLHAKLPPFHISMCN